MKVFEIAGGIRRGVTVSSIVGEFGDPSGDVAVPLPLSPRLKQQSRYEETPPFNN